MAQQSDRRQPREKQVAEIRCGLELLIEPGAVHELRALEVESGNGWTATFSGYFDNLDLMAKAAAKLTGAAAGVYLTLNPVVPELLARCANRMKRAKDGTKDHEILCRRWLLVDIDPVRPRGISATDVQHEAAVACAGKIRQWLMEEWNWPAPIVMDSGNGAYLLFRIGLENNTSNTGLIKRVLETLDQRFSDAKVEIDITTFNAARIMRIPGTLNRKGDSTADRPHRRSRIVECPRGIQ